MAVLSTFPGLEVTLDSMGQRLKEFDDDDILQTLGDSPATVAEKTTSKYVEASTGLNFVISYRLTPEFEPTSPALQFFASIDGVDISAKIVKLPNPALRRSEKHIVEGCKSFDPKTKSKIIRPLKFCSIKTTEDDRNAHTIQEDMTRLSKVGRIEVRVCRANEPYECPRPGRLETSWGEDLEVHEKALKGEAKSHSVSLGPGRVSRLHRRWSTTLIDDRSRPIANFIFQYRSREALQALLLLESTAEPESQRPPKREISRGLSDPNIKDEIKSVKRERNEDVNLDMNSVKKPKKAKYEAQVTIDLTLSDDEEDSASIVSFH